MDKTGNKSQKILMGLNFYGYDRSGGGAEAILGTRFMHNHSIFCYYFRIIFIYKTELDLFSIQIFAYIFRFIGLLSAQNSKLMFDPAASENLVIYGRYISYAILFFLNSSKYRNC